MIERDIGDARQRDGNDKFEQAHCSKGVSIMGSSICFDSDDVVERVRQRVLEEAEEKTRLLTCPEHRQPVKLTFDGNALTISSCCLRFEKYALVVIGKS